MRAGTVNEPAPAGAEQKNIAPEPAEGLAEEPKIITDSVALSAPVQVRVSGWVRGMMPGRLSRLVQVKLAGRVLEILKVQQ